MHGLLIESIKINRVIRINRMVLGLENCFSTLRPDKILIKWALIKKVAEKEFTTEFVKK